jgi:hypothetical protein
MSPVCENRPHMVYARVCRGMCKMIGRSLLEIFVKGGTVSRLCRSELATVGSELATVAEVCRKMRRHLTVEKEAQAQWRWDDVEA